MDTITTDTITMDTTITTPTWTQSLFPVCSAMDQEGKGQTMRGRGNGMWARDRGLRYTYISQFIWGSV